MFVSSFSNFFKFPSENSLFDKEFRNQEAYTVEIKMIVFFLVEEYNSDIRSIVKGEISEYIKVYNRGNIEDETCLHKLQRQIQVRCMRLRE